MSAADAATSAPEAQDFAAAFEAVGKLEKQFAAVELDALRRKEHAFTPLYAQRASALSQIPGFWRTVFLNAPEEVQALYSSADVAALAAIKDFRVERPGITSATEGEPRHLKFTFVFEDNELFEGGELVKEFEYRPGGGAAAAEGQDAVGETPGSLVSKPVPIKWKSKKNDLTKGMLDMAVELEKAEEAMRLKKGGQEVDLVEREGLWQYEKLREAIEKSMEAGDEEPTFLNWFGFRGAVEKRSEKKEENGAAKKNGDAADAEEEDEDMDDIDFDDGMLDVEIFPAGEDVAIALADELWPNALDIFMEAQEDDDDVDFDGFEEDSDDEEGDEDEAPELVEDSKEKRPSKRQRTQ